MPSKEPFITEKTLRIETFRFSGIILCTPTIWLCFLKNILMNGEMSPYARPAKKRNSLGRHDRGAGVESAAFKAKKLNTTRATPRVWLGFALRRYRE
ncbi:MAG: hypothetical protein WEA56_12925 [Balneolaceae bacterium]